MATVGIKGLSHLITHNIMQQDTAFKEVFQLVKCTISKTAQVPSDSHLRSFT